MPHIERIPLEHPPFPLDGWTFHGEGAFSLTYRAHHARHGPVVIKELFPVTAHRQANGTIRLPFSMRGVVEQTFLREALNLAALQDAHVPALIDQRHELGNHYLILEVVEGVNLHQWFARLTRRDRGREAGAALASCFCSLADTLAQLEQAQIVHGDIAPANILVRSDENPVIIDFGSAFSMLDPHLSEIVAHPGFRMPGPFRVAEIGHRLDLFGLCASFYSLFAGRPPVTIAHGAIEPLQNVLQKVPAKRIHETERLVRAIDFGLAAAASPGHGASGLARLVRTGETSPPRPGKAPANALRIPPAQEPAMPPRFQTCLLQSFDTPRFREDDRQWLVTRDGSPLATPMSQKIALARAEALLAVCFGREIVVPAGQVADSPGFQAIFTEIMDAYTPQRAAIREAFARAGMPEWRPFRLGIENAGLRDYQGFTRSYRYTGAPMVLLEVTGGDIDREERTRQLLETAGGLFNQHRYEELGDLMLDHTGRENYGRFARTVAGYFDETTSLVADAGRPEIGTSAYAHLFRARLGQDDLTGIDPAEVAQILGSVERIEAILAQQNLTGLRGNWYLFRKDFGASWQLARAYLDFRLFMNLARLYGIDHPILVSQAVEAGRYDHSLMLGPRFRPGADGTPARDTRILRLAGRLVNRVKWDEVFEMVADPRFIRSIVRMNRYYFDPDPASAADYQDLIRAHGAFLGSHAADFLTMDVPDGRVAPTLEEPAAMSETMVDAVEASMVVRDTPGEAAQTYASGMAGMNEGEMHEGDRAFAMAAIAPLDRKGAFNIGLEAADYMLNYYFKPYRLALNRGF